MTHLKKLYEKGLNNAFIYLRLFYFKRRFSIIMTTSNIEIKKTIIGAFFGAVYSVVLIAPLTLMMENTNQYKLIFYPLTIFIGYAIIYRSLEWKSSRNVSGGIITSLIEPKFSMADFLLAVVILIAAYIMRSLNIINSLNAYMWIIGVTTILLLQMLSIPKLLDETRSE